MENNNEYKCVKCSKVVLVDNVTCEKCTNNKRAIHNISKREYFAAMAMQGYIASGLMDRCGENTLALHSVTAANALIETLNNTDNPNLQP